MSLLNPYLLLYSISLLHLLIFPPVSCNIVNVQTRISSSVSAPSPHEQGVLMEEKTRLGSTPPSCYNRCNSCNPCKAVQVPTLPTHNRVKPGLHRLIPLKEQEDDQEESLTLTTSKEYTNYKPLGWKCRCGDHLFNP